MKILTAILFTLISTTTFAAEPNQKIDFERITSKQLSDLTNECLDNDYSGNICKQLKEYQDERRAKAEKAAVQLLKHSHY